MDQSLSKSSQNIERCLWDSCHNGGHVAAWVSTDRFPEVLSSSYAKKKRKRELRRDEKRQNTDIQDRNLQSPYPLNQAWVEEGKGEKE